MEDSIPITALRPQFQVHHLKVWPKYYQDVYDGFKTFEVRKDDRGFNTGDGLHFQEWDNETGEYTGRESYAFVVYKLPGGAFGIEEGFCVLGIRMDHTQQEIGHERR